MIPIAAPAAEQGADVAAGVVDIRPRPMWDEGWEAEVTVRWDTEQFSLNDVVNLLNRAGMQVGVGEGRPDSKNSAGMGWGTFNVKPKEKRTFHLLSGADRSCASYGPRLLG